jgi:hypothetical protein
LEELREKMKNADLSEKETIKTKLDEAETQVHTNNDEIGKTFTIIIHVCVTHT